MFSEASWTRLVKTAVATWHEVGAGRWELFLARLLLRWCVIHAGDRAVDVCRHEMVGRSHHLLHRMVDWVAGPQPLLTMVESALSC